MWHWIRRRTGVQGGALIGLAFSLPLTIYWFGLSALEQRQYGLGTCIVLVILGFPWSMLALFVTAPVALLVHAAVGVDLPAMPLFLAMPLIAGCGWGWVVDVAAQFHARRQARSEHREASA